jgi:uncharacterized membrane protein YdjX (TVP38/TMEM64 family)
MKKLVILLSIGCFLALSFFLQDYLNLDFFNEYKDLIAGFVLNHYILSVILFILACTIFVNSPVPLAGILKIMGGFLFGATFGSLFSIVGTFFGALLGFAIARYLLRDLFEKHYGKRLHPIKDEIKENGLMYFITLRFSLVIPYFLIHVLGGISKLSYWKFVVSSLIGVVPGAVIYGVTGSQLEKIESMHDILTKEVMLIMGLLVLFSLIPIILKKTSLIPRKII